MEQFLSSGLRQQILRKPNDYYFITLYVRYKCSVLGMHRISLISTDLAFIVQILSNCFGAPCMTRLCLLLPNSKCMSYMYVAQFQKTRTLLNTVKLLLRSIASKVFLKMQCQCGHMTIRKNGGTCTLPPEPSCYYPRSV